MPTKMFFSGNNCVGADLANGQRYDADRSGFIHVDSTSDVAALKAGGYVKAGGMPRLGKYWVCDDCSWDSAINHCRYCDSTSLRKVER